MRTFPIKMFPVPVQIPVSRGVCGVWGGGGDGRCGVWGGGKIVVFRPICLSQSAYPYSERVVV